MKNKTYDSKSLKEFYENHKSPLIEGKYRTESIRDAVKQKKVPLKEADKLYDQANKEIGPGGKWIELGRSETPDYATGNQFRYFFETGGCLQDAVGYRYWGTKKVLNDYRRMIIEKREKQQQQIRIKDRKTRMQIAREVIKEIKYIPENLAEKYFRKGIIPGKTHEIFGGYPYQGNGTYQRVGKLTENNCNKLRRIEGFSGKMPTKQEDSSSKEATISVSTSGSKICHRHWELGFMYEFMMKKKKREK